MNDTNIRLDALVTDAPPQKSVGTAPNIAREMIHAIISDSREVPKYGLHALFVAITGSAFDGHDFLLSAYNAGCRIFAVSHECALPEDALQLIYPDTRIALALLSASFYRHPSKELTVIGVTGTKGKTTTCLLIEAILNGAEIPTGYIGTSGIRYAGVSHESPNTTPESLILQRVMRKMADAGIHVVVMEVSSQALMQHRVYGIDFSQVVFTNLSLDHVGKNEHPDFEHYKSTKRLLFTHYRSERAILNRDDPHALDFLPGDGRAVATFSTLTPVPLKEDPLKSPALWASDVAPSFSDGGSVGVSFTLHKEGVKKTVLPAFLPLPGACNVQNALAALLVCDGLFVPPEKAVSLLRDIRIVGRCEPIEAENGIRVLIDYAHNEASLREILRALRDYTEARLIVLFGSVGGRTKERRAPMGAVASALADFCILTSDNPDFEPPENIFSDIERGFVSPCPYVKIPDRKEAIQYGLSIAQKGDILLLAGKGHESYQLVSGEKLPFSEREIVKEWLSHTQHV